MNQSWAIKKQTSKNILKTSRLIQLDRQLSEDPKVVGHKLCGAGGGGFFLVVTRIKQPNNYDKLIPVPE